MPRVLPVIKIVFPSKFRVCCMGLVYLGEL